MGDTPNQVESDVIEPGVAQLFDGDLRASSVMTTSQESQGGVIEGLNTEANSADSHGMQARGASEVEVARIAFHGYFEMTIEVQYISKSFEEVFDQPIGQDTWRTSAEIERIEG